MADALQAANCLDFHDRRSDVFDRSANGPFFLVLGIILAANNRGEQRDLKQPDQENEPSRMTPRVLCTKY